MREGKDGGGKEGKGRSGKKGRFPTCIQRERPRQEVGEKERGANVRQ